MALSINNNMMALTAANNLTRSYSVLSKSINRLSSGMRINSAADDAAGLAVRELMRSDIAVLHQGIRNANDAISMLQTMDGAAAVIDEKLIRMKELAEQSATGTYSNEQRAIMNDEFVAMRSEIERIAQATDFNGIMMLKPADEDNDLLPATNRTLGYTEASVSISAAGAAVTALNVSSGDAVTVSFTSHDGATTTSASITVSSSITIANFMSSVESYASAAGISLTASWTSGTGLTITDDTSGASSLDVDFGGAVSMAGAVEEEGIGNTIRIHFGTGSSAMEDYYYIEAQDMTTGESGLNIGGLSITSQNSAVSALAQIDRAILEKDTARAHFGAVMNRLEATVTNLTIQAENIQAAESQISDVDVAFEMTNFMNTQIKAQAAISMLSQANSLPQLAMQLLQGG